MKVGIIEILLNVLVNIVLINLLSENIIEVKNIVVIMMF